MFTALVITVRRENCLRAPAIAVVVVPESSMTHCPFCTIFTAAAAICCFSGVCCFCFSCSVGSNNAPDCSRNAPP